MISVLKFFAPASFLVLSMVLVPIDSANACTSGGSTSSLSYGSSISGETVTVCVGTYSSTPATSSSSTSTTTTKTPTTTKKTTKSTTKTSIKSTPKPTVKSVSTKTSIATCPTASQLASMPKSADAAERWIDSICNPPKTVAKPSVKSTPKPKAKPKTTSKTTTLTSPASSASAGAAVSFVSNPIRAIYFPQTVLGIGQLASFSADPVLHYKTQRVLGRMAEVEFTPISLIWIFSDGVSGGGNPFVRSFEENGSFQAVARVTYRVKFRLLGETSWQLVQGAITSQSNRLNITVGESLGSESDGEAVLLVGQLCTNQPQAFGCD